MSEHSVHLRLTPEAAQVVTDALVAALYGGRWPEDGRRCLLAVSDALHEAVAPVTRTRNLAVVRDRPPAHLGTNGGPSTEGAHALGTSDPQDNRTTI